MFTRYDIYRVLINLRVVQVSVWHVHKGPTLIPHPQRHACHAYQGNMRI
jgi:hypothetical protein